MVNEEPSSIISQEEQTLGKTVERVTGKPFTMSPKDRAEFDDNVIKETVLGAVGGEFPTPEQHKVAEAFIEMYMKKYPQEQRYIHQPEDYLALLAFWYEQTYDRPKEDLDFFSGKSSESEE